MYIHMYNAYLGENIAMFEMHFEIVWNQNYITSIDYVTEIIKCVACLPKNYGILISREPSGTSLQNNNLGWMFSVFTLENATVMIY